MNGIKSRQFTIYLIVSNCTKLLKNEGNSKSLYPKSHKAIIISEMPKGSEERMGGEEWECILRAVPIVPTVI